MSHPDQDAPHAVHGENGLEQSAPQTDSDATIARTPHEEELWATQEGSASALATGVPATSLTKHLQSKLTHTVILTGFTVAGHPRFRHVIGTARIRIIVGSPAVNRTLKHTVFRIFNQGIR